MSKWGCGSDFGRGFDFGESWVDFFELKKSALSRSLKSKIETEKIKSALGGSVLDF